MEQAILTIISSITGVILGFILGIIKERAKLQVELVRGSFTFYESLPDRWSGERRNYHSDSPNVMELNLVVNIFNSGRANTAIKKIDVELRNNGRKIYLEPMVFNNEVETESAFNVSPGSVEQRRLYLKIFKDDNNDFLFENIILDPDNKHRMLITVHLDSINDKSLSLEIEPMSIYLLAMDNEKD